MEENERYEYWKPVVGTEYYEISNQGNVRNIRTGRILKSRLNRADGYPRVRLDGKEVCVHRLMEDTFSLPTERSRARKRTSKKTITTCGSCPHRYMYDFCMDKSDDFYCAYGQND